MFLQLNCSFPVPGGACVVAGEGGGAWFLGGMHGSGGVCMVARGHVWLPGGAWLPRRGMHGCQGACMVAGGYAWFQGGHAWLAGGMHGSGGACMVARGACHVTFPIMHLMLPVCCPCSN